MESRRRHIAKLQFFTQGAQRAVLTIIVSGLLAGCGTTSPAATATAKVTQGNLIQTVSATGTSVTATQAKLTFKLSGKIAAVKVGAGDSVRLGQVLAQLDPVDLQTALQQAQAADDSAKAAVGVAQARVAQLQQSAKPETIAGANAAVDAANQRLAQVTVSDQQQINQAQAAVQAAQAKLQALQNGPRPEQIAVIKQQVATAKNSLYTQQINRDALCNGVNFGQSAPTGAPLNCAAGQAAVNAAQTAVDQANDQLALQTAPPLETDLQQAQAAVSQAEAQLATAQSNAPKDIQQVQAALTQARSQAQLAVHPYTDADLQAAQAGVQQAQAQVGQADAAVVAAQNNLDAAQLKAPADGKVLQVNNAIGESVTPASVVVVLGIGDVLVNASLSEADISKVKIGQDADVTLDGLPGKILKATVADLPPAASTAQNLVAYVATIKLSQPDPSIRPGMSARITIYTLRKDGTLLVPSAAVQNVAGGHAVTVVEADGKVVQTPVQVGASSDQNTEIVSGLSVGQTVTLGLKPGGNLPVGSSISSSSSPSASPSGPAPAPAKESPGASISASGSAPR